MPLRARQRSSGPARAASVAAGAASPSVGAREREARRCFAASARSVGFEPVAEGYYQRSSETSPCLPERPLVHIAQTEGRPVRVSTKGNKHEVKGGKMGPGVVTWETEPMGVDSFVSSSFWLASISLVI